MADEAVKVDPDAMGHKSFHEKASSYGEAFEGSYFEPGVKASDSKLDYESAKADAASDVFNGKGYDEDTAKGIDDKFETYMTDRKEMEAQAGQIGKDQSPDAVEDGKEDM